MKSFLLKYLLLILLFVTTSLQSFSQTITWNRKGGPTGGTVKDVEYDPVTGKVFTLIENKIFVSTDNGTSWTAVTFSGSNDYFYDIEITNGVIYLITGYDLYTSTDGGLIFSKKNNDSVLSSAYKLKRLSSGTLIALSSNRVYYSTTNGVSWVAGASGSFNSNYLVVNNLDQIFAISASTGLPLRSTDGGATFTTLPTNINITAGGTVYSLTANNSGTLIYCVNATGLWSSTNANTWTSIKGSISDATVASVTESASFLEFSGDGLGMYFIDNVNKKLHYKGVSELASAWQLATSFPGTNFSVTSGSAKNYLTPATSTAIFGTFAGLFRTTTGGGTIFDANSGITGVRPNQLVSVFNGDLIMKASSVGLLRSTDQGNSWTGITTVGNSVFNLSTNSAADNIFAAPGSPSYALYRSQDKGVTWTSLTLPVASGGFRWASGSDNNRVFASSTDNTSIYYSYNNGTNWTAGPIAISGLPVSYSLSQYSFSLASSTRLLLQLFNSSSSAYEYWRIDFTIGATTTISGLATKIQTTLPFANISKITAANGRFYAYSTTGSPDQVATSTNGGATWTITNAPTSSGDMFVTGNGYIFVSSNSDNKLFISRDNGATFSVDTTLPSTVLPYNIEDIALDQSGFAYLAVDLEFVHKSNITVVTPAAPSGLTLVGKTATGVAMKWNDNSTYESYYQIERSTDGINFTNAGQFSSYDICSSPTPIGYFVDKGLTGNTAYTFRVKAVNDAGSSSTITLAVTTLAATTPNIPDNRSWTAVNSGETGNAVVTPKTVSVKHLGGGKYDVSDVSLGVLSSTRRETFFESSGQTMLVTTNGSDPIKPNSNGTWNSTSKVITLKWRECQDNDNDAINDTETITLTLNASDPIPLAPTGVSALVVSNSTVEVSWVQGFYEKEYVIERSLTSSSGFSAIATVQYPATSFIDNGPFVIGTTYFYKVKSRNANVVPQDSPYSAETSLVFRKPNFVVSSTVVSNLVAVSIGSYWADFNNDGLEDLFALNYDFATEVGSPVIFQNLGTGNFLQISISIEQEKYFQGFSADLNNDGFSDIALSIDQKSRFDIYRGNGDFTFTKWTDLEKGDIALISNEIAGSSSVDFNNDGRMDILVLSQDNSIDKPELFKQNAGGSFTKVSGGDLALDFNEYFSSSWADYDNDGDQDVVIAKTGGACSLYKNNGNETFSLTSGIGFDAASAFSFAWGDYNNDGHLDLYAAMSPQPALYKNNGNGTFTKDISTSITEAFVGISAAWGDINNDGLLDLITPVFFNSSTRLFINTSTVSTTSFTKITTEKISDPKVNHYGSALHDYDKDGFLDLFMAGFYFPPSGNDDVGPVNSYLYKNNNSTGNWTQIRLAGIGSNKRGIGARIIVTADGKSYVREVASISSALSQNSPTQHIGIGSATAITNIQIKWPSGMIQNYPSPPINQVLVIPEDGQSPTIITQTPVASATNVSTNTTIEITFSEASIAIATKKLIVIGQGEASPFATIDVTTAVKTGNKFTFTLPAKLATSKQYNITLDAGAFTDIYGNASLAVASGWTFTTSAGPIVSSFTPAHNATGVSAATSLAITFSAPVTAVATKNILVYDKSNLTTPVATLAATTGVIAGNTVTFTLAAKLNRQTVYVVSVDAGAFIDGSSNDFAGLTTTAWEFTTSPGPTVSSLTPALNATGVSAATTLAVTFSVPVTAVATKNILVYDKSNLTTSVATLAATTGVISGNTVTFALAAKLNRQIVYVVSVDAGAFVDASSNDFGGLATTAWEFTTDPGPTVLTFLPANTSTNILVSAPLELTFNKSVTAVAGKKIKVMDGATVVLDVAVSTTGTITGAKYSLPAPTGGWPFLKSLSVLVDAGAFVDANQNDFVGLAAGQYSFTTTEAPDVTAPSFGTFAPLASVEKANLPSTIKVSPVTDNKAVAGVKMFYRPISGSTFTEVAGTASTVANEWIFSSIPATAFDALGVQYYFTAVDAANNSTRNPAGTTYHQTFLKYATADTKIPAALIGIGGKKTHWKVIAVPFDLGTNNSVPSIFDELATNTSLKNEIDYMLLTYKGNSNWSIYPEFQTIDRGKGYFINIKSALSTDITVGDNLVVPTNSRDNLFKLNLKTGWNMIGNPYLTSISWADVVAYNSLTGTSNTLKKYSGGSYSNGTSLSPFEGGFVNVAADIQISIPFQGQTAPGGRQTEMIFGDDDWVLPITLRQGELENTFGGIGMHKQASVSFDAWDDINAPRFFDYLEMNFDHPDHYARKFARDVVPTQEEYTWKFTVDSNIKGEVQLSWDNIDWTDNEKELYLLDEETQTLANMRETKRFLFNPAVSSRFGVFFGTDVKSKIKPNRVLLGNAYPNPTTGVTTIPFTLPDQAAGYQVHLDVYDMMGRKITTILNGTFNSGFYNSEWDASVGGLSGGMYTYRLTVSSTAGTEVQSGKIMITK